jgi:hypothetical protein
LPARSLPIPLSDLKASPAHRYYTLQELQEVMNAPAYDEVTTAVVAWAARAKYPVKAIRKRDCSPRPERAGKVRIVIERKNTTTTLEFGEKEPLLFMDRYGLATESKDGVIEGLNKEMTKDEENALSKDEHDPNSTNFIGA